LPHLFPLPAPLPVLGTALVNNLLSESALDELFREARVIHRFIARALDNVTIVRFSALQKWGPTAVNARRALGFDIGPMSGFEPDVTDAERFQRAVLARSCSPISATEPARGSRCAGSDGRWSRPQKSCKTLLAFCAVRTTALLPAGRIRGLLRMQRSPHSHAAVSMLSASGNFCGCI
jgi:hypothetical protein